MNNIAWLPRATRLPGILLALAGLALHIGLQIAWEEPSIFGDELINGGYEGWWNEIAMTFWLVGHFMLAFSRFKVEDEYTDRLRLLALYRMAIALTVLTFMVIWLTYDNFLSMSVYLLFGTIPLYNGILYFQWWRDLRTSNNRYEEQA